MKKNNKSNNGGFSLVELVAVVAIMAILIAMLAPQYLRYVEKSRLQRDNSGIAEIANAIKIAMVNEDVYNTTPSGTIILSARSAENGSLTFTFRNEDGSYSSPAALNKELALTLGDSFTTASHTYRDSTVPVTITIIVDETGRISVTAAGWIESTDGSPTPDTDPKVF